jgi:hypothetical protein
MANSFRVIKMNIFRGTDANQTTADYAKIMHHMEAYLLGLAGGGGPEAGLARKLLSKDIPLSEKIEAASELIKEAPEMIDKLGEIIHYFGGDEGSKEENKEEKPFSPDNVKIKQPYEGLKPGTIVHPRNFRPGSNIKVLTDSTGQTSDKAATDTINHVH